MKYREMEEQYRSGRSGRETVRLSLRLDAVAAFVPEKAAVADIGTDHGYIPIHLIESGRAAKALAMDVGRGPLNRAREHIEAMEPQFRERIELRLSDGLKELKAGEADTVVIAGMGGELIIRILDQGRHVWETVKTWVLSPQSEPEQVRQFLAREGFGICREQMVKDGGKYYTIMEVKRGTMPPMGEAEYRYGPCLIRDCHPVLLEYLDQEEERLSGVLKGFKRQDEESWSEGQRRASRQLQDQLELIFAAREKMKKEDSHEMRGTD